MQIQDRGFEISIQLIRGFYVAFINGERQGAESTTPALALQSARRAIDRMITPTIASKLGRTSQIRRVKPILLTALAACALAGNVRADNPQTIIHSTHAEEDARNAAAFKANEPQTYESLYRRIANTPHENKVEQMYHEWLITRRAQVQPAKLTEGDPIPQIADVYDDAATIKLYLHDAGYTDLSDAEIAKVHTYMHEHGIKHVSQLTQ